MTGIYTGGVKRISALGQLANIATGPVIATEPNPKPPYAFAREWINFNGTSGAVRGGTASVTDLGTGRFRVNFAITLSDPSYIVVGSARREDGAPDAAFSLNNSSGTYSSSAVDISVTDCSNGTLLDPSYCCVAIYR